MQTKTKIFVYYLIKAVKKKKQLIELIVTIVSFKLSHQYGSVLYGWRLLSSEGTSVSLYKKPHSNMPRLRLFP